MPLLLEIGKERFSNLRGFHVYSLPILTLSHSIPSTKSNRLNNSLHTLRQLTFGHRATSQDMEVEVEHRLATGFTIINHQTEAVTDTELCRNPTGDQHQVAKKGLISVIGIDQFWNGFFGDYQHVGRCLGLNIPDHHTLVILV